jgi:predicted pyridoxine 5'-phosphate oxidase superfamily flavin-nucleotide-binding protein
VRELDDLSRRFIALCPFVCIGSTGSDGSLDVSPCGDPPGFVKVLDDRTLVLPDRAGNRGLDTMRNVFETGSVGMILFVPGIGEVLRINGTAASVGPASSLLAGMVVRGTTVERDITSEK